MRGQLTGREHPSRLLTADCSWVCLETPLSHVCHTSVEPTVSKVLWGTATKMFSLRVLLHAGSGSNMSGG